MKEKKNELESINRIFFRIFPRIIQKRKLFSRLDIFILVLMLILFLVFLFSRVSQKTEWVAVEVRIGSGYPTDYWYLSGLHVGDVGFSSFGQKNAEVTNVYNYDLGGSKRVEIVDLKLLVSYDKPKKMYIFNYQTLQVGKSIDMTFGTNGLQGNVSYIGGSNIAYKTVIVDFKLFNTYPWLADSYKKGLKVKDSFGRTVAEILDVTFENSKTYETYDTYGRRYVVKQEDPDRKDVTVTARLSVTKENDVLYYVNGGDIRIGDNLWIWFPQTSIQAGIISKIYE